MVSSEYTITAEWARKEAQTVLSEKVKTEISQCEKLIIAAVKRNEFSCDVSIYPHELTITELTKRGFDISKHSGDQRDGSYISIKW